MRYQHHETVPEDRTPAVTPAPALPEADLLNLINSTEDLERSLSALRGATYGIAHGIRHQEVSGEEIEALLMLISDQLDRHAQSLTERVMLLVPQRRSTDRRAGQ